MMERCLCIMHIFDV